jgi:hypothetical protein
VANSQNTLHVIQGPGRFPGVWNRVLTLMAEGIRFHSPEYALAILHQRGAKRIRSGQTPGEQNQGERNQAKTNRDKIVLAFQGMFTYCPLERNSNA